ncbi:Uncharacterised protein [Klebsiella pneumoniae]|nr:Uncharacterised protein [Klebsiella pneumoniae]
MRENAGQLRELLVTDPVRFLVEAVCFAHDSFKELIGDARKPIVEICHAQLL